jgi:hypothetical protein
VVDEDDDDADVVAAEDAWRSSVMTSVAAAPAAPGLGCAEPSIKQSSIEGSRRSASTAVRTSSASLGYRPRLDRGTVDVEPGTLRLRFRKGDGRRRVAEGGLDGGRGSVEETEAELGEFAGGRVDVESDARVVAEEKTGARLLGFAFRVVSEFGARGTTGIATMGVVTPCAKGFQGGRGFNVLVVDILSPPLKNNMVKWKREEANGMQRR